ncbi:translational GTPase TypA, partial [Escherichia coli]|nr:translational GTPase TypA [Escherichia coli]
VYASGLNGYAGLTDDVREGDMKPLFETILDKVPQRNDDPNGPFQLQIISLDYSSYVGKIGVGRITRGRVRPLQDVVVKFGPEGNPIKGRINQVLKFRGLERELVQEAEAGDIVLINGIEELGIGCTVCAPDAQEALPMLK